MNEFLRSLRWILPGVVAGMVALPAPAQVVVYKLRINPRNSVNIDFYNGGYFVTSPTGGDGSFVFTQKKDGTKTYKEGETGTLFTGVTESGERKWVVQATSGGETVAAKSSYVAFGTAGRPTRFTGLGYDTQIEIARTMRGGIVASTTEADPDNPDKLGFAGDFDWKLVWDEGQTNAANKKGNTIEETLADLVADLAQDGFAKESATPVSITTSSLAGGVVGTSYSQTLAATGGTSPYTWTSAGALPGGLNLSSAGVISGEPTSAGTYTFTVKATDSATPKASASASLTITIDLKIDPSTLPAGVVGATYNQTLFAVGGTAPYAWTVADGSLPAGLSLDPTTGVISGAPTAMGTSVFTVKVTDNATTPHITTKSFSVSIGLAITTSSPLPDADLTQEYSQMLLASGGTAPYIWALGSGSALPDGLSLSAAGLISGIPTTAGSSTFTVAVHDSGTPLGTATKSMQITVLGPLKITTTSLPTGFWEASYSQSLAATGGATPYTWSMDSGSLPAGLSLDPTTGVISGDPIGMAGTSNFSVKVTDTAGTPHTDAKFFSITISDLVITTASSLPNAIKGAGYTQTLAASGGIGIKNWTLVGTLPAGLTLAGDVISGIPTMAGTFTFNLRVTDSASPAASVTKGFTLTVDSPSP